MALVLNEIWAGLIMSQLLLCIVYKINFKAGTCNHKGALGVGEHTRRRGAH